MKAVFLSIAIFSSIFLNAQTWVQKASLPSGNGQYYPFEFSIGGKIYVGGGWNGSILNTFFQYDPTTNAWIQKANLPDYLYGGAFFSINGMGYIVCGQSSINGTTSGVYMYNPTTNTWTPKNNFPGSVRYNTIGFSLNGMGYVFGGFVGGSTVLNDMWQYNPTTDSWVQMANAPGPTRDGPTAIVINNQAYVGLGSDVNGAIYYNDFYKFDPVSNSYTQVANSPVARSAPAHFVIGSIGYIGLGHITSYTVAQDFTTFNPSTNTWTTVNNFGGAIRGYVFSDTIGNLPYVGCGAGITSGSYSPFYNDNWTWASCDLTVNLGNDTTVCSPGTIILRDTFSHASSLWSTGDTTAAITVISSGTYWLRVTQGACKGSDTININFVTPPAAFDLGNDTTYCGPFTRTLSSHDLNTIWSTGATDSSISVSAPGAYRAVDSNMCGIVRDSIIITDNPLPVVNLGNDTDLCTGSTLTLNATTANAGYLWQNGTTAPTFTVTSSGTYSVAVTVNGCTTHDSIIVGYINPVTFNIGNDTTYCGSFVRTLTAGIAHTVWSTGDTAISITVDMPGTYRGSIIACGDTLMDSIILSEKPLPVFNIGDDTTICTGSTLTLNAATDSASYLWQNGSTDSTYTVSAPGTYRVDVTVNGCTKADSIDINYESPPSGIALGGDTSICEDSSVVLNAYEPLVRYVWNNGDTTASIVASQSGLYTVTVSNECGSTTASEIITVTQCVCKVAIPNAFSPNNDGRNDSFGVLTQCPLENFELDIFNRWGQKVFSSNAVTTKWDGTYRGVQQPLSVYVYMVRYRDPYTNEDHNQAGNVTLLR